MNKKILLIEDDSDLFGLVKYNLEKEGFVFCGAQTGKGAVDLCRSARPDLLLLDILLPDGDGLDICRRIRQDPEIGSVPIIFLTARGSESDRVVGLELGANDYMVKPFFVRELVARIRLQFRQIQAAPGAVLLRAGGVELNRSRCEVLRNGKPVPLTATEFRVLEYLMGRPGIVFSRGQLLDAVWGGDHAITDRAIDVYILRLRQKLESGLIHSVRGFGYMFEAEPHATGRR
ncbi:MAG: response regulator transcription factor [Acidobacteriia bacterium]|nr:response regulator transcription factor [Terriglobia bacterium]